MTRHFVARPVDGPHQGGVPQGSWADDEKRGVQVAFGQTVQQPAVATSSRLGVVGR